MNLIKLSAIASTNDYLKEMISKISVDDETVVWTNSQTSGRGQRGTSWYAEPGKSLAFSLLKRHTGLGVEAAVLVNLAVSLAVARALDSLEIPSITVKWPNDIMSDNKKIAGILIENQLQGDSIASSVIGIGINVNNRSFENLPHAGSLHLATGNTFDHEVVLKAVNKAVLKELRVISSRTFETLSSKYGNRLFRKGEISEFLRQDGSKFRGEILGVNSSGNLLVKMENGNSVNFRLKEIELLY